MPVTFTKGDDVRVIVRDKQAPDTVLYKDEGRVTRVEGDEIYVHVPAKKTNWIFDLTEDKAGRRKDGTLYLVCYDDAPEPEPPKGKTTREESKEAPAKKEAPKEPEAPAKRRGRPSKAEATEEGSDPEEALIPLEEDPEASNVEVLPPAPGKRKKEAPVHTFSRDNCKNLRTKLLAAIRPVLQAEGLTVIPLRAKTSDVGYTLKFNIVSVHPNEQGELVTREGGDWHLMAPLYDIDGDALGRKVETFNYGPGTIVGWNSRSIEYPVVVELDQPFKSGTKRIRMSAREVARQYPAGASKAA